MIHEKIFEVISGYTRPIEFGETNQYGCGDGPDVYTVEEFRDCCKCGAFIDDDGHGRPIKNNMINTSIIILPSEVNEIPEDATHIVWYNK